MRRGFYPGHMVITAAMMLLAVAAWLVIGVRAWLRDRNVSRPPDYYRYCGRRECGYHETLVPTMLLWAVARRHWLGPGRLLLMPHDLRDAVV